MIKIAFFLIGSIVIVGTIFTLLKTEVWWVRIFDFPRIQLLVMAICSLLFFIAMGYYHSVLDRSFLILLFSCSIYQTIRIIPYTPIYNVQVNKSKEAGENKENKITILVSNIFMDNRESRYFKETIKKSDPDLILILEADKWWENQLSYLIEEYQYHTLYPLDNTYGILLYSKLKLINPKVKFLLEESIPSIETIVELPSGKQIKFYGIHPKPPSPQESLDTKDRDAELVIVGKEAKKCKLPVIVAGDLNDVAWSHTTGLFQRISGLLDPRRGRGMYSTFNANNFLFRWPLDHVFHSSDFKLVALNRLPHIKSDHFPICITLNYEPSAKQIQDTPDADNQDKEEAEEKIEEAKQANVMRAK